MGDTGPVLRHFPPSRSLAGLVAGYWYSDEPAVAGRERKLPAGSMQLIVNLDRNRLSWFDGPELIVRHTVGGIALTGCIVRPVGIDLTEQRRAFGIVLAPAGARGMSGRSSISAGCAAGRPRRCCRPSGRRAARADADRRA